jgi:hypothetical protein
VNEDANTKVKGRVGKQTQELERQRQPQLRAQIKAFNTVLMAADGLLPYSKQTPPPFGIRSCSAWLYGYICNVIVPECGVSSIPNTTPDSADLFSSELMMLYNTTSTFRTE